MRKFGYVIAVLGAIAVAAPSIASAETVLIKHRTMAGIAIGIAPTAFTAIISGTIAKGW